MGNNLVSFDNGTASGYHMIVILGIFLFVLSLILYALATSNSMDESKHIDIIIAAFASILVVVVFGFLSATYKSPTNLSAAVEQKYKISLSNGNKFSPDGKNIVKAQTTYDKKTGDISYYEIKATKVDQVSGKKAEKNTYFIQARKVIENTQSGGGSWKPADKVFSK